jgi:KUP system potassium uptake protein
MMAVATIAICLSFRSSARLAGAYGTAVATTMVLTTLLLFRAMHKVWKWPMSAIIPLVGLFLVVDLSFFVANLAKIADGGWVPLTLGACIFFVMVTWRTGAVQLRNRLAEMSEPAEQFLQELKENKIARVPGTAVFLTRTTEHIPAYVADYVRKMGALHKSVVALNIQFEEHPRVSENRFTCEPVIESMSRVTLRYGFNEIPDIPATLKEIGGGLPAGSDPDHAVFFGTRDMVMPGKHSLLGRWRLNVFTFLYRNAARAIDRFNLPAERTIELARQVFL